MHWYSDDNDAIRKRIFSKGVHQTAGVAEPVAAPADMLKGGQIIVPNLVAFENGLLPITAGGDVEDGAGIFTAERTGHDERTVARKEANVNSKDPAQLR